eukprot:7624036-Pyramimonas_sp.AAC.1
MTDGTTNIDTEANKREAIVHQVEFTPPPPTEMPYLRKDSDLAKKPEDKQPIDILLGGTAKIKVTDIGKLPEQDAFTAG